MHGLLNNLEWCDYIHIDICRHGFNYYNFIILFFFFAENEPLLSIHEFRKIPLGGPKSRGRESAPDIRRFKHEFYNKLIEYSKGPPKYRLVSLKAVLTLFQSL